MTYLKKTKQTLIAIGYWYSDFHNTLPKPQDFEDKSISEDRRRMLIKYLDNGKVHVGWRGYSQCRYMCGIESKKMGSTCLTDGKYIWPEGLSHYIENHDVWLPDKFIDHVVSMKNIKVENINTDDEADEGDFTWWKSFVRT